MTRPDLAQLLVDRLPVIDRTIAALSTRYALTNAAAAEYSARVKRAMVADDYALLASAPPDVSFETYVATVAAVIHRDGAVAPSADRITDALYGTFSDDRVRDAFEDASAVAPTAPTGATPAPAPAPIAAASRTPRRTYGIVIAAVVLLLAFVGVRMIGRASGSYEAASLAADAAGSPMLAQTSVWPPQALGAVVSPSGVASRVGALLVDLETTSERAATARTPAIGLVHLLDGTPGGADAVNPLRALAGGANTVPSKGERRAAGTRALGAVDRAFAGAGEYLEAARLAAAAGTLAFFDRHPTTALDPLRAATSDPAIRTAIDQFELQARRADRSALALSSTAETALRLIAQ